MAGATLAVVIIGAVLLVCYGAVLWRGRTFPIRAVLLGAVVGAIAFTVVSPQESTDVYAYGYFGRLAAHFRQNPYTVQRLACSQDPYLQLARTHQPIQSPYGPAWTGLSATILTITTTHTTWSLIVFRSIAIIAFLGSIIVLWKILAHHPERNRAIVLYAWNPLILFEVGNGAHNDIVVVLLILLALFAFQQQRYRWVPIILATGVVVKFITVLIAPLFLIALIRAKLSKQQIVVLVTGVLLSLIVLIAAFSSVWDGWNTFGYLGFLAGYVGLPLLHPLTAIIGLVAALGIHGSEAAIIGKAIGTTIAVCGSLVVVWKLWQRGGVWLGTATAWIMALLLAFGTSYFEPWYLLWLFPLTAFWPRKIMENIIALLTFLGCAAMITFTGV